MARTWGEIRLVLTKFRATFDPELINEYILQAYEDILDARPWLGLRMEGQIVTAAVHNEGTVSLSQNSATVSGNATNFSSSLTGRTFRLQANYNARYTFTYVSGTQGTLDRQWEEADVSAAAYEIFQNLFELPDTIKYITEVINPHTQLRLEKKSLEQLNEIDPAKRLTGEPKFWAPHVDTDESVPAIYHTLELYPVPIVQRSYPYVAQKAAVAFDGTNTSDVPMPWVSTSAIIERAKQLMFEDEGNLAAAGRKEQTFLRLLNRMMLVEDKRKGPRHIKAASTWTEHYRLRGFQ